MLEENIREKFAPVWRLCEGGISVSLAVDVGGGVYSRVEFILGNIHDKVCMQCLSIWRLLAIDVGAFSIQGWHSFKGGVCVNTVYLNRRILSDIYAHGRCILENRRSRGWAYAM